jgi:biotin transporter BioY
MFRKTLIAAAAVATIAAAALAPTAASAKSFKHWGGKSWGYGFGFVVAAPLIYGSCVRYVENRYGDLVRVYVC